MARIGIYAGTFDPVHAGHVAFALQSLEAAKLDRVYFLPERRPRGKRQVKNIRAADTPDKNKVGRKTDDGLRPTLVIPSR